MPAHHKEISSVDEWIDAYLQTYVVESRIQVRQRVRDKFEKLIQQAHLRVYDFNFLTEEAVELLNYIKFLEEELGKALLENVENPTTEEYRNINKLWSRQEDDYIENNSCS